MDTGTGIGRLRGQNRSETHRDKGTRDGQRQTEADDRTDGERERERASERERERERDRDRESEREREGAKRIRSQRQRLVDDLVAYAAPCARGAPSPPAPGS